MLALWITLAGTGICIIVWPAVVAVTGVIMLFFGLGKLVSKCSS